MINLKKIVAVALAATMCMGVSVTALADNPTTDKDQANAQTTLSGWDKLNSNSPTDPDSIVDSSINDGIVDAGNGAAVEATNGEGERNDQLTITGTGIDPNSKAWDSINTVAEVLDVFKENGLTVKPGSQIIPMAAAVVNGLSDDERNVLTFTLPASDFSTDPYNETVYHPGDTVYAMMETGENTGVWEMVPGTVNDSGKVDFDIDHKGAVILIKTMKNGKIVAIEKDEQGNEKPPVVVDPDTNEPVKPSTPDNNKGTSNNAAAGSATTGTSPRTGEF